MEEVPSRASGEAGYATAERFTSCADEESRLLSDELPLDFPNMLLSLLVLLIELRLA
jgi:hypothetical protein